MTEPGTLRRRALWRVYVATVTSSGLSGMYYGVLQGFVTDELGGTAGAVGIAVGAVSIGALLARVVLGRLIDRHGRRLFMVIALAIWASTAALFLVADTLWFIVALRLAQGVASGAFGTAAATLAIDLAPAGRHARAASRFTIVAYVGFTLGPLVAVWGAARIGYAWCWVIGAALAVVAIAVVWGIGEPTREPRSALAPRVARRPGQRLSWILHPAAVVPGLVMLASGVGWVAFVSFYELYAGHLGMGSGAPIYLSFLLALVVFRLLAGSLADRWGRLTIALPAVTLGTVALVWTALAPTPWGAVVGATAYGTAFGLVQPALMALTTDSTPPTERATAVGSFMALFDIGTGLGAWAIGWVIHHGGFSAGYATAAVSSAVVTVLLARTALRRRLHPAGDPPGLTP